MNLSLNILNNDGGCDSGGCDSGGSDGQCGGSSGCGGCGESSEAESRRRFLKKASSLTLGSLSLTLLPAPAGGESEEATAIADAANASAGEPVFGFLVDTEKCIGAGKCLTACREENDVPEGYSRTWVERYVHFKDGSVQVDLVPETGFSESGVAPIDPELVDRSYFAPKLCNQCDDAPCNQVCPVHASFTSPEGIELVDPDRCIGCAYCVQACPYGVRFINPETNNADKCTWCYHRIKRNQSPACVEACPVDARVFGRIDDPDSEISKRLKTVPTSVLKEHLGTHPKLHYVAKSGEVI